MDRQENASFSPKRQQKSHWKRGLILFALLALAAYFGWHTHEAHERQEEEQSRPANVTVAKPKPAPLETSLILPGTIEAIQETPIYARTNGYLTHWYHDIGAPVRKGDLLADIDTPDIQQQLQQTRGALRQAEANLNLARVTAARWKLLARQNAVAQQDADEKQANYLALLANVAAARSDVKRLTYLESFRKLYAPFTGVVTERTIDDGALITTGNGSRELFKVAEIDRMKIYVGVPQSEARAVQPGIQVEILLKEFPDRRFTGVVARTSRAIDPVARTLLTEVDIPNPDEALLTGMYAQVKFTLPSVTRNLIVPASVIVVHTEAPKIITVTQDGRLHFVPVVIGRDYGQETEIVSGLSPDARMVVNPNDGLVEGEKVEVEEKKAQKPKPPQEEGKEKDGDREKKKGFLSGLNPGAKKKNDEGESSRPTSPTAGGNGDEMRKGAATGENKTLDSGDKLPERYQKKQPKAGGQGDQPGNEGKE